MLSLDKAPQQLLKLQTTRQWFAAPVPTEGVKPNIKELPGANGLYSRSLGITWFRLYATVTFSEICQVRGATEILSR